MKTCPWIGPLCLLAVGLSSAPVTAQTTAPPAGEQPTNVYVGDFLIVGVGAFIGPSYSGSDDYVLNGGGLFRAQVSGIGISGRPAGLAVDFIPNSRARRVGFALGPLVRVRTERTRRIVDPVVAQLDDRDVAIELGVTGGVSIRKVASRFDVLSFDIDVQKDVAGKHGGWLVSPSVSYISPVSRSAAFLASVSAEHVDDDFARYYSTVTAPEAARTGLPAFNARGGWKRISANVIGTLDFDGNLLNGGWSVFGGVGYSRLLGDARRSPIVSIRGTANQPFLLAGVGYTF